MSNIDWQKVNGEGEGTSSVWDFDGNPELEGHYVERKDNVGRLNSTVYKILTASGEKWDIWDSAVLSEAIGTLPIPSYIKVVYKGKRSNKSGMGSYKDFDVFVAPHGSVPLPASYNQPQAPATAPPNAPEIASQYQAPVSNYDASAPSLPDTDVDAEDVEITQPPF